MFLAAMIVWQLFTLDLQASRFPSETLIELSWPI